MRAIPTKSPMTTPTATDISVILTVTPAPKRSRGKELIIKSNLNSTNFTLFFQNFNTLLFYHSCFDFSIRKYRAPYRDAVSDARCELLLLGSPEPLVVDFLVLAVVLELLEGGIDFLLKVLPFLVHGNSIVL